MERLKRPESRRMAQPLASVGAFEGFEGFEAFEGQFRATRKGFGAPEPRAHSLRNSAHSLAEPRRAHSLRNSAHSLAEPRAHSLASARFWSV